jgi:hypothetical protein
MAIALSTFVAETEIALPLLIEVPFDALGVDPSVV